ncbi:hypothetical protein F5Y18DRAFT_405315 [Xylariaceae sp. FL1019]|nr:hypothetical protein F5Y18DRAFT_405315 [Xylariaceae sp. FL1019]
MHHFTTSTCLTLASDPNVRNFWRVNVPQIGFAYPYVLKGILALSALHLSRLRPQQRDSLVKQAMVHHNASTSMVMPILSENVIGNDEFTPVFCYSMLTTTITFARPRTTDDFLLVSNGILPEWLLISRGVTHLIEAQGEHIFSISSMDALFHSGKDFTAAWLQHGDTEHEGLRELEANIRHDVIDSEQLTGLEEGIIALRRSFGLYAANGHDEEKRLRSVLVWVIMLPQSFITLLRSHCCEALCVLAYYCVLLKRMEHVWWVEGWAFHLIERIYSALDERHRLWIRWPLEEIGWAP